EASCSLNFTNAHTAGADSVDIFKIAKSRDFNTALSCSFQNRGSCVYGNRNIVYFQIHFISHISPLLLDNSAKLTIADTYAALDTFVLVDIEFLFDFAGNGVDGTLPRAERTAFTSV